MTTFTTAKKPAIVQAFDRYVDREYYKVFKGIIFGSSELVRTDRLENELIINITSDRNPDYLYLNGKR